MTYKNPKIIADMLRNNGTYPGDPQMTEIYSFEDVQGKLRFAVFDDSRLNDISQSPYVRSANLLWSAYGGLTIYGQRMLERIDQGEVRYER